MNELDIIKTLEKLRGINPNPEYSENSRMQILVMPQHEAPGTKWLTFRNAIEVFRLSTAVGIAGFLLVSLLGGVSYLNNTFSPFALDGLNQNSLKTEAAGIDNSIEVTLKQISYLDQSNKAAIKTITQVSTNKSVFTPTSTPEEIQSAILETTSTIVTSTAPEAAQMSGQQPAIESSSSINDLLDQISQ